MLMSPVFTLIKGWTDGMTSGYHVLISM